MNAGQIIGDSRDHVLERIKDAQDALGRQELERAIRYYLQAAHAAVDGLRGAGVLLLGQAEYLPPGDSYTAELMMDLNTYLNGKQLFPRITEIVDALQRCLNGWADVIREVDAFDMPQSRLQPEIDRMPDLLNRLEAWRAGLIAGAGGNPNDEAKRAPGVTGVGYDTLLRVRDALEEGKSREEIRGIVRESEAQDSGRLIEMDEIIRELSDTATKVAAATRVRG